MTCVYIKDCLTIFSCLFFYLAKAHCSVEAFVIGRVLAGVTFVQVWCVNESEMPCENDAKFCVQAFS